MYKKGDIICILENKIHRPYLGVPNEMILYISSFGKISRCEEKHLLVKLIKIPGRSSSHLQILIPPGKIRSYIKPRGLFWIPRLNTKLLLKAKYSFRYRTWRCLLALAKLKFGGSLK